MMDNKLVLLFNSEIIFAKLKCFNNLERYILSSKNGCPEDLKKIVAKNMLEYTIDVTTLIELYVASYEKGLGITDYYKKIIGE